MTDEQLQKLKEKLVENMTFPSVYMYKFIIQSEHRNIALIENLFEAETHIHTKESRKGKYISVTARQVVVSVDEIIDIYKRASAIKGVMFL
jgi:putative lipoic acid-binding regulatory protein